MKRLVLLFVCSVLACSGCKKKPKEYTATEEAQAANFASEAQFAMQIKEFARAEELLERAVKVRDDVPEFWATLGMARRRLDKRDDARKAYREALALHEDRYARDKRPEEVAQCAWVTALLGKTDEALKILEQGVKAHPESEALRRMADPRGLPRTFKTEQFKELAL